MPLCLGSLVKYCSWDCLRAPGQGRCRDFKSRKKRKVFHARMRAELGLRSNEVWCSTQQGCSHALEPPNWPVLRSSELVRGQWEHVGNQLWLCSTSESQPRGTGRTEFECKHATWLKNCLDSKGRFLLFSKTRFDSQHLCNRYLFRFVSLNAIGIKHNFTMFIVA